MNTHLHIAGSSEMLQKQMGWFSSATFYHLFNVTNAYVLKKIRILLLPFLHSGPKTRARESISHASFKAPRYVVHILRPQSTFHVTKRNILDKFSCRPFSLRFLPLAGTTSIPPTCTSPPWPSSRGSWARASAL